MQMRCKKANRLLSEKLDGMLSPRENAALAKHLDQCPACRRRLTDYMQLDAALADLEQTPPAALQQNIMAEIAASQPQRAPQQSRRFLWGPGTAVAAAAAVLLLLLGSGKLMLPAGNETAVAAGVQDSAAADEATLQDAGGEALQSATAAPDQASTDLKQGSVLPEPPGSDGASGDTTDAASPFEQAGENAATEMGGGGDAFDLTTFLAWQELPVLVLYGRQTAEFTQITAWDEIADGVWEAKAPLTQLQQLHEAEGGTWYGEVTGQTGILLLCP